MMNMIFTKIAYIIPKFKKWYPNISVATFIRFVALIIASFIGCLNTAMMEEDINDTSFLYAFSKVECMSPFSIVISNII